MESIRENEEKAKSDEFLKRKEKHFLIGDEEEAALTIVIKSFLSFFSAARIWYQIPASLYILSFFQGLLCVNGKVGSKSFRENGVY